MKAKLVVFLENIRSAYNVGSIFRTCESAGVDKLVLGGYTPFPPNPKLDKTALQSIESVSWVKADDMVKAIGEWRGKGYRILAAETIKEAKSIYETDFGKDCVIIFGNEVTGVSPTLLALADEVIKIPMMGKKESLNIATATGIIVYEWVRYNLVN